MLKLFPINGEEENEQRENNEEMNNKQTSTKVNELSQ